MNDVWPKHLTPDDAPWARRVESGVKSAETALQTLGTQVAAQNQGTAASLDALREQIATLQEQQAILAQLVDNSVAPVTAQNTTTNFAIGTSIGEINRSTISVPTGYTRALVLCSATVTGYNNNVGVNARIFVSADINGVTVASSTQTVNQITWGGATSTYSTVLTGVSGSIYTRAMAYVPVVGFAADAGNVSNLSTMVLFLR